MQKKRSFTKKILWLAVIIAVLATGAAMRDGKLLGHDLRATQDQAATTRQRGDTLSLQPDGGIVVNTKPLAKDVSGYGGPVPLRIHISNSGDGHCRPVPRLVGVGASALLQVRVPHWNANQELDVFFSYINLRPWAATFAHAEM